MRVILNAAILAVVVLAGAGSAQHPAPWFGAWKLDPAAATPRPEPSPYKRVELEIEPWEDGLKVVYDMVGTRGGRTHLEWTGAFDGRDYPMHGLDYVLTNAYRLIDENAYGIVVKMDGAVAATTRVEISPDGETLTAVTTEKDAAGATVTSTAVYRRQ